MKKLKIIRIILILLLILSVFLIYFNFSSPEKIEINDNQTTLDASMLIENGESEVYSNDKKIAILKYLSAINRNNTFYLKKVELLMTESGDRLFSDSAIFKKGVVYFNEDLNGFLNTHQASISVKTPSEFENGVLKGRSEISVKFSGAIFSGNDYIFNFQKNYLILKRKPFLISGEQKILSHSGISLFSRNVLFVFWGDAKLRLEKSDGILSGDVIRYKMGKRDISISGKCRMVRKDLAIKFTSGSLSKNREGFYLKIRNLFDFLSQDAKGFGNGLKVYNKKIFAQYINCKLKFGVLTGINNIFKSSLSTIEGENPYIVTYKKGIIKGKTYNMLQGELKISDPVYRDDAMFVISHTCLMKQNGEIIFPEKISGVYLNYSFYGSRGNLMKKRFLLYNGKIISIDGRYEELKALKMEFKNGKVFLSGRVFLNSKVSLNNFLQLKCDRMLFFPEQQETIVNGNIIFEKGGIVAKPEHALIFKTFAILFNNHFKVEGMYNGFAKITLINFNARYSYLFNSFVKDVKGNALKGQKLTYDNQTDKIFVEKASGKSQVEVEINL